MAKWLDVQPRSDSELLSLRKFAEHFPDRPLEACTAEDFTKALSFCKTPGTFTRYRTMLTAILRLSGSTLVLDKRVAKKAKPRDWITPAQWERLLAELPAHMKPMAEFSIETGLRQENVLALRWEKIDLERKHAWFDGYQTKNGDPMAVPLSSGAMRVLLALPGPREGFVFLYRGKPIAEVKTAWRAACVRAGVPNFTWHGLRHTWATWHAQADMPLAVLQALGGWKDPRMVANYAHHSTSHLAAWADHKVRSK